MAFANCLTAFVGAGDHEPAYRLYCEISARLWQQLEQGVIQEEQPRVRRWEELGARRGHAWSAAEVAEAYLLELARHGHLSDGALEVCSALRLHHALGIVSNGFQRVQSARLAATGLGQLIDFVVTSELAGAAKPARAVFERALALAAALEPRSPREVALMNGVPSPLAPERVLMVGDSLAADIAGGRAMGFVTCWFNPQGLPEPATPADYTIGQLSDLLSLVYSN